MLGIIALAITLETLSVPVPVVYQNIEHVVPAAIQPYTPPASQIVVGSATQEAVLPTSTLQTQIPTTTYQSYVSPDALLQELQSTAPTSATLVDAVRPLFAPQTSPLTFDRILQTAYVPVGNGVDTAEAGGASGPLLVCGTGGGPYATNLTIGDTGVAVRDVQQFLNRGPDTRLAESGAGSPGNETDIFAQKTFDAVKKFQTKYAAEILAPINLVSPTGIWGPSTRAYANKIVCTTAR